jgi:hypothetical protein
MIQCLQTIKLFRNAENIIYFSFFSSFLHKLSNAIFIYIINECIRGVRASHKDQGRYLRFTARVL